MMEAANRQIDWQTDVLCSNPTWVLLSLEGAASLRNVQGCL
jgi:hypothetical protein